MAAGALYHRCDNGNLFLDGTGKISCRQEKGFAKENADVSLYSADSVNPDGFPD